jgi:hypothetical protein
MSVRIGCAAGFWGDRPDAAGQLLEGGDLDYLAFEYLAEVTMGLLDRLRRSDRPGYATDFVRYAIEDYLELALEQDVTLVTNAGGLDPAGCATAVREYADQHDLDVTVATVAGDGLTGELASIHEAAPDGLVHADTGASFDEVREDVVAAAAYLGAFPIAEAIERDADVVITGRVVDPALVLGPLLAEYGWERTKWDLLAAGIVAGHLIECGTQVTGGNLSKGWRAVDFSNIGYPIAAVDGDGTVRITKPPGTGGTVSEATVSEQLVYEIGDPTAYLTPDVTADFTTPTLEEVGPDEVRITGVRGRAAPERYKVSVHHRAGYKLAGNLLYSAPDALAKARLAAEILRDRIDELGLTVADTRAEFVGHDATHGPAAPEREAYNEIMLRFAARGQHREDLRRLGLEFAPLSLSGPPSVAGLTDQGRPKPRPVVDVWPTLVPKPAVEPTVTTYE